MLCDHGTLAGGAQLSQTSAEIRHIRAPAAASSAWAIGVGPGERLSTMLRPLFRIEVFENCEPVRVLGIQAHWWGDWELCLGGFGQLSESENGTQRQQQRNLAQCDLEILGLMVPPWRRLRSVVFAGVESTLDGAHQAASFRFNYGSPANVCIGHANAGLQGLYTVCEAKWRRARRSYGLITPGKALDRVRRESSEARATPVDSRTTSSGLNMYSSPALVRFFAPARIASNIL
jgi:hypothetical protein